MAQFRFNQVFIALMAVALLGSLVIPPSVTDRAKGKEELLLWPIVRPVRGIAGMFQNKYGERPLPPGETGRRNDSELAVENAQLRQQVVFLSGQLEDLRLVEAERKRLGKLLDYFAPVTVVGGDATPGRESLGLLPASGVNFDVGTPVMCGDGLVGRIVEGRRVRLITDNKFTITGQFGRWENQKWVPLSTPKASVTGVGGGTMRVEHLTVKEAADLKPTDWVIVADGTYPDIVQGRQIGQVETVRPMPSKPLFAEITIKPRTELRKLSEVLVMKR